MTRLPSEDIVTTLPEARPEQIVLGTPVRDFPSYAGMGHYPGWWSLGHELEDFQLARCQAIERGGGAVDQPADDEWVQGGAFGMDAVEAVEKIGDVGDPARSCRPLCLRGTGEHLPAWQPGPDTGGHGPS